MAMAKPNDEMAHWQEYDYIVVNRDLDNSFVRVCAILVAGRPRAATGRSASATS
jgi:guanylate kinase